MPSCFFFCFFSSIGVAVVKGGGEGFRSMISSGGFLSCFMTATTVTPQVVISLKKKKGGGLSCQKEKDPGLSWGGGGRVSTMQCSFHAHANPNRSSQSGDHLFNH